VTTIQDILNRRYVVPLKGDSYRKPIQVIL
jgi:hypothetical protein